MRRASFQQTITLAIYLATAAAAATQYIKIKIANDSGGAYPGVAFGYTNPSSPYYNLYFLATEDQVEWGRFGSASEPTWASVSGVGSAVTVNSGDIFGITSTGTGTSTVVRVWRNPTGLPTAADNWDGIPTPNVTFTNDPASPVDTGKQCRDRNVMRALLAAEG